MKDRLLLLIAAIVCAGAVALLLRSEGEYTPLVSAVFAVVGIVAYLKRRMRK